jgi:hypothetical protein
MHHVGEQLIVLVSGSDAGDALRRELAARGLPPVSATANLAHLRRSLVREGFRSPVILCITLDEATLRRHGRALARLLDDRTAFPTALHAIGVACDGTPVGDWAAIGCDAWASSVAELEGLVDRFATTAAPGRTSGSAASRIESLLLSDPTKTPRRAETREVDLR